MADTVGTGPDQAEARRQPDADAYRRAGLTRAEAVRREKVERWRGETQSPWEASLPGVAVWLVWRAVLKGFQPFWLIASLVLAGWFVAQWLGGNGGIAAATGPVPDGVERLRTAIARAVPAHEDPRAFWTSILSETLDGDRRRPDIDRFRSWAALGPDLVGRDRLALDLLAGPAGPGALDARLRAGPPWEREASLDAAFRQELVRGEAAGLVPRELVFADDELRRRYARSQFEWQVIADSANAFFGGRRRGEFEMRSVPGLVRDRRQGAPTRLYGGVRHLVIQACAHAAPALAGCEAPIIPAATADPVRYSLAALESGFAQMHISSAIARSGAETLQAARLAGQVSPQLDDWLAQTLDTAIPPAALTASLAGSGLRTDLAFAAPDWTEQDIARRFDARTQEGAVALSELLRDVARIRERTSPVLAIRLMAGLDDAEDVRRLRELTDLAGERALAVRELLGREALVLTAEPAAAPASDPVLERNIMLALMSAALVVLLTLIRLTTPQTIRKSGRLALADAWMSRLVLGRKT